MSRNTRNKRFELNPVDARDGWAGLLSEEEVLGRERAIRDHFAQGAFYGRPDRSVPVPPTRTLQEIADPYLTAGSAIAGTIPAGIGGVSAGILDAVGGGSDPLGAAAATVRGIQDDLTFMPRSLRGSEDLLSALKWMEENPVLKAMEDGQNYLGDKTLEVTGSPGLATAAFLAPELIETAFGAPSALNMGRKVSKQLARLDPGVVGSGSAKMSGNQTGGIGGMNAQGLKPGTSKLAYAMRQSGASPDEIWKATGDQFGQPAYFDREGNFGFEFDDSKAAYLAQPRSFEQDVLDLGDKITPLERGRLMELRNKYHNRTWQETLEFKDMTEKLGMMSDYGSMRAHFQHPEIDKHYPTLLDDVQYREQDIPGAYGEYADNQVTINPWAHQDGSVPGGMRSTNLHELSGHAVQDKANLPRGGNPGEFAKEENAGRMRVNGFMARAKDAEAAGDTAQAAVLMDKARALQAKLFADPRTPDAKYYALTGEANARAIQKRRNMTMEERLARPFYRDFDDRGLWDHQIVKYR
ncbi:hypothetical protein DRQ25_10780 [Candidatus Fermentibacteria bacterium]|nr:MAG: hypothetical protein DRQ25_10780 [Candidatus Fermentibacteria bacterium]